MSDWKWPQQRPHKDWEDCDDPEIASELRQIAETGRDITKQIKAFFVEAGEAEFAEGIERADAVWDGQHAFGLGIKMFNSHRDMLPPEMDDSGLHVKLMKSINDGTFLGDPEQLPVDPGVFHALRAFEFRQEIDETLGKDDHEPDG